MAGLFLCMKKKKRTEKEKDEGGTSGFSQILLQGLKGYRRFAIRTCEELFAKNDGIWCGGDYWR